MHAFYTYLALDIANQRTAEANDARLAALGRPSTPSVLRRAIARVALAVARAADEDLRVSLSPR
jgi:hypothetical protein